MRKTIELIAVGLSLGVAAFFGCSSKDTGGPGGTTTSTGQTSTGTQSGSSSGSGTGSTTSSSTGGAGCNNDGVCQDTKEDCSCGDCLTTAFCNPDQCVADGKCTLDDACTCKDCWAETTYCSDPNKANCKNDGTCDSYHEGCLCNDCKSKTECAGFGGSDGGVSDAATD